MSRKLHLLIKASGSKYCYHGDFFCHKVCSQNISTGALSGKQAMVQRISKIDGNE